MSYLFLSNSAGYEVDASTCLIVPSLPLHIQMLSFLLICSFILSCLPLEQCSLNPLFSVFLEKYYFTCISPVCKDGATLVNPSDRLESQPSRAYRLLQRQNHQITERPRLEVNIKRSSGPTFHGKGSLGDITTS